MKISTLYSKEIQNHIKNLEQSEVLDGDIREQIQLFKDILAIWTLFETLHLKCDNGQYVTDFYISWLNENFEGVLSG